MGKSDSHLKIGIGNFEISTLRYNIDISFTIQYLDDTPCLPETC